jgi:hypothetical protein
MKYRVKGALSNDKMQQLLDGSDDPFFQLSPAPHISDQLTEQTARAESAFYRSEIAKDFLAKIAPDKTCARLELNVTQYNKLLSLIEREWEASAGLAQFQHRARINAELEMLQGAYMEAWENSKKPKHSSKRSFQKRSVVPEGDKVNENGMVEVKADISRVENIGDVRFLNGVLTCIERRAELLGLSNIPTIDIATRTNIDGSVETEVEVRMKQYATALGVSPEVALRLLTTGAGAHVAQEYRLGQPLDSDEPDGPSGAILDVASP